MRQPMISAYAQIGVNGTTGDVAGVVVLEVPEGSTFFLAEEAEQLASALLVKAAEARLLTGAAANPDTAQLARLMPRGRA